MMDRKRNTQMQVGTRDRERALSPFTTVRRMMEDMDRVFGGGMGTTFPQVEVLHRGDDLVVRADLPGLDANDVNVEVDDDTLTIKGERTTSSEDEQNGYFHSERSYGSFERRILLPPGCDRNSIDASFQNGVLEVTMKLPKTTSQRIPIRGASAVPTTHENKTPQQSSQTHAPTPQQTKPESTRTTSTEQAPQSKHN